MTSKALEKLNIKIAKKLGWKSFRKEYLPEPLQKEKRMTGVSPGNFRHQFVPSYANNLAYAMQCVTWAIEHLFRFKMINFEGTQIEYEVTFSDQDGRIKGQGYGSTPQMAICMAFMDKGLK